MQVLKDSIRERIEASAIKLFRSHGYDKVSMRKIAADAHMTVGNIYRYFDNKDHLFESLITPTLDKIMFLVSDEVTKKMVDEPEKNTEFVKRIIDIFLDIHRSEADILDMLINSCEGSRVNKPAATISGMLASRMENLILDYIDLTGIDLNAKVLSNMLCDSLVDNFIRILYEFDDDESRKVHMYHIAQIYTNLFITTIMVKRKEA